MGLLALGRYPHHRNDIQTSFSIGFTNPQGDTLSLEHRMPHITNFCLQFLYIPLTIMPEKLPSRRIGRDGPEVPALGLGTMGLSAYYGTIDDDETRFKFLDRAYELGATFWDTADVYGDSEELIGKWFKRTGKRDEIFLVTKVRCSRLLNGDELHHQFRSEDMSTNHLTVWQPSPKGSTGKRQRDRGNESQNHRQYPRILP